MSLSYNTLKIYGLLLTLPLPGRLAFANYDIQSVAVYAKADLSILYINGISTPVLFDNILDILKGKPFEHLVEINANQIFPNETVKREMINKSGSLEFDMPIMKYDLLGFNISASDIEVNASSKQVIDDSGQSKKTRIDFPVMLAKNVNVSNEITTQTFNNVDLSSIYAIYDPKTDKFTFHVPYDIAARFLLKGS